MSVMGLRFIKGILSDTEGELSNDSFFTAGSNSSSQLLAIFVKPKLGGDGLSSFSSTICSKLSWPMMVSSGCSASEKKGLRYLLLSSPVSTQKTVYETIFKKGRHSSLIFLFTQSDHFSILSSLSAAGEKRMYLKSRLRSPSDAFMKVVWERSSSQIEEISSFAITSQIPTISTTSSRKTNLGAHPLTVFTKSHSAGCAFITSQNPHSFTSSSSDSKQYCALSFSQMVKPPSECPIRFSCLVLRNTSSTYTMQHAQKTAQCSEKSFREMGGSLSSAFLRGRPRVQTFEQISLIILLQGPSPSIAFNTQQNYYPEHNASVAAGKCEARVAIIIIVGNKIKRMEGLNRNGSYVQRRKMYIQFPLHNMKSKIPIDWSVDEQLHPLRRKENSEKEYIRRVYDQKMDSKIRERYNSGIGNYRPTDHHSLIHNDTDVLTQELEHFNTSKVANSPKQNPQFGEPLSHKNNREAQGESSHSESRYRQQDLYRQERENYENQEPLSRDRHYTEKERNFSLQTDRERSYNQRAQNERYYYDRDQRHNQPTLYAPIHHQPPFKSQKYLQNKSTSIPSRNYKDPYLVQKQYHQDLVRQYRKYAQKQPQSSEDHPFRNALPDRLQEFLREKTKLDRKSSIKVPLKNKP